jgi:hypothetical protein
VTLPSSSSFNLDAVERSTRATVWKMVLDPNSGISSITSSMDASAFGPDEKAKKVCSSGYSEVSISR